MKAARIFLLAVAGLVASTAMAQSNESAIVLADVTITAAKPADRQIALQGSSYDLVWEGTADAGIRLSVFPSGKPQNDRHRLVSYTCVGAPANHNILTYWNPRVLADQHLVDVASLAWREFLAAGQAAMIAGR